MFKGLLTEQVRSKIMVVAPMVVLTLIFAGLMALVLSSAGPASGLTRSTLVWGIAVYLLVAGLLVHFGLSNLGKLESLGLTDSLSGVPNRRALHQDATRTAQGQEMALALIDLDGFKIVNDHYGHFVGDRVIKECATILKEVCGKDACSYRLGGDEFAILVVGPIAGNILEGICRKLLTRFSKPLQVDDRSITLGASVGLSRSDGRDGLTSSELLRRSDVAMYVSKTSGKMRCTWFSEEFDSKREAAKQIEIDLRKGLDNDELRLLYQPLVDAKSGKIVAVEALLRWQRADGVPIGPDVFIPIAEESGLIDPIGLWVLRKGCKDAEAWEDIKLSINVSAAQLRNPEFPVQLGQILEESGFPPARLELEVTETYLVLDPVVAGRSMEMIKQFGVGVVLDDFGTGYASIGFLRKFRFEKLKIDRSLIVDAAIDDGSHAMMVSSIAVARAMDMDVTAEGVETEAQADLVRIAGCDQIQGWLFFKPITADEVTEQLALGQNDEGGEVTALRA
ncbi:MAG TPA: bifunctional diguanylate cyclase/phosphodiesterase [Sphingomonadaceae bacterium]|nr:bifunctional diguanylate cyclase/phosphodiesterase [Sphingomonadaceae bacterium]